jgi:hypothetical protein
MNLKGQPELGALDFPAGAAGLKRNNTAWAFVNPDVFARVRQTSNFSSPFESSQFTVRRFSNSH